MDNKIRKRKPRPLSFDRDAAVNTAMRLFWRHGYEGVSVSDLTEAIGIAPPSLYAAFGNKLGLFREALDRYAANSQTMPALLATTSLEDAIELLLNGAIDDATLSDTERGCMMSTALSQCGLDHQHIGAELRQRRKAMQDKLAEVFARWVPQPEAEEIALYLTTIMQGFSVQIRDGASKEQMQKIAKRTLRTLVAPA
jgi:AcrR family transcriptional regulator